MRLGCEWPIAFNWGLAGPLPGKLGSGALALLLFLSPALANLQSIAIEGEVRVFDGDTLEIGPVLIRLHGIDAPEKGQSCNARGNGTWRCGATAMDRLSDLIEGAEIACEALDRDPYGRIIARCKADGVDLAATLMREGLAWAFVEYSQDYVGLEDTAWSHAFGVWQAETQTPWAYRDDKWNRALAEAPDGKCPIKGNIGSGKDRLKIYHTPWSPNYGNTKIDVGKGERWFCDEAEAMAAGWRAVDER
ncbi:thermonuclease family protein [uncultured Roseobacter sp.]|uniref:thermonuclease family protein n=1 Tax=uncultured Roseobacter sp. TaxID=114847 RepID=UPI00261FB866|nr:thermonuclease family protein [uncultured Roseobacter sp.]